MNHNRKRGDFEHFKTKKLGLKLDSHCFLFHINGWVYFAHAYQPSFRGNKEFIFHVVFPSFFLHSSHLTDFFYSIFFALRLFTAAGQNFFLDYRIVSDDFITLCVYYFEIVYMISNFFFVLIFKMLFFNSAYHIIFFVILPFCFRFFVNSFFFCYGMKLGKGIKKLFVV